MRIGSLRSAVVAGVGLTALLSGPAYAGPSPVVVTEADVVRQAEGTPPSAAWVLYTRAGTPPTAAAFVDGPGTPPAGVGSLRLTTATGSEKVFLFNYDHVGKRLADVADIAYSTYRTAGEGSQLAALNLQIDANGPSVDGGFSTLVFEPVYNPTQQPVSSGVWQRWTADGSGLWWSTRAISGQCAGATYDCFRTWEQIVASNPDATVLGGVGVNQGSGNAGLTDHVDAFTFDRTTDDFERDADRDGVSDTAPPTSREQCKNGGYGSFNNPSFKNQGDCVSYVSTRS